jgi:hypothetical protein
MRAPIDLTKVKVFPLAQRASMARIEDVLIDPSASPALCAPESLKSVEACARHIREARGRKAGVMFIYGAHLIKNGGAQILIRLMERGWITHLATNGAGTIHDWEFSYAGVSTESVLKNVARGCFGTWDETGRNIMLAILAGGVEGLGYGAALGKFIAEDGATLPDSATLETLIAREPSHPLTPARAELLQTMRVFGLGGGRHTVKHPWKSASVPARAFEMGIPFTVHPGIGYDIICTHPMYNGGAVGRAAGLDFKTFANSLDTLDGGVAMSVGSAIMGPQVFEKSISCVNNLRLQAGRGIVSGHNIYVVDLQDGGHWDWTAGEPPKTNPAYYLRFCKSYSRMGGAMHYVQCDNVAFIHHLLAMLG